jgi:hypothetical protein
LENCPNCGNALNGVDPNFCDYCQRAVAGPAANAGLSGNQNNGAEEKERAPLGVLDRCPSCGKLFAGEEIKKEEIDSNDILKKDLQPKINLHSRRHQKLTPTDYVFKTTRVTYQCKYFNYQWAKDKTDRVVIHSGNSDEDRQYWNDRD